MARQQCKVSYLLAASISFTIGSVSLASTDSGQLVDETDGACDGMKGDAR
jgi:hypothetical protein